MYSRPEKVIKRKYKAMLIKMTMNVKLSLKSSFIVHSTTEQWPKKLIKINRLVVFSRGWISYKYESENCNKQNKQRNYEMMEDDKQITK